MTRKSVFLQGTTANPVLTPAEDVRLALAGLYAPDGADGVKARSGVLWGPGAAAGVAPCTVATPSAGTVTIAPGHFIIQGNSTLSGAYLNVLDAAQTVTVPAASLPPSGQFKAGYVLLHQYDTVYNDSQDGWLPEVLLGPAAATSGAAVLPVQPVNSIALRTLTIDSAGNITLAGTTPYTALSGTPVVCTSTTRPANPWTGCRIHEADTHFERRWDGAHWEILFWTGQDRSAAGLPAMAGYWPSGTPASIPNNTPVYYSWNQTAALPSIYATASDSAGPLMQMVTITPPGGGSQQVIQCNAKGRVRVIATAYSDSATNGYSRLAVNPCPVTGQFAGPVIREQRTGTAGYANCGTLEQWLDFVMPVTAGDQIGYEIVQVNSGSAAINYISYLQVEYL